MNMKSVRIFGVVLASFFLLQSCKKDDAPVDESTIYQVTVSDLAADTIVYLDGQPVLSNGQPAGAGKFTLYSLEDNAVIALADSNSLKGDIGFRGTMVVQADPVVVGLSCIPVLSVTSVKFLKIQPLRLIIHPRWQLPQEVIGVGMSITDSKTSLPQFLEGYWSLEPPVESMPL